MPRLNRRVAVCAGGVLLAGAVLLRAQAATPSAPPQSCRLHARHRADLQTVLLRVPRPDRRNERRAAALLSRSDPRGRRVRAGHRAGKERRQLSDPSHPRHRRRRQDADGPRSAARGDAGVAARVDRSGRRDARDGSRHGDRGGGVVAQQALGLRRANATGPAVGRQRRLGAESDRPLRPRAARARTPVAVG